MENKWGRGMKIKKRGVAVVINVGGGVKGRRGLWQIGEWEGENSEVGGRGDQ